VGPERDRDAQGVSDVEATPRRTVSGRRGRRRGQAAATGELVARAVAVLIRVTVSMSPKVTGAAGGPHRINRRRAPPGSDDIGDAFRWRPGGGTLGYVYRIVDILVAPRRRLA